MAVKVYDTISPASNSFPALMAEHVNLVREDGTTDSIQNLFNNKELGAGGDTSTVLTSDEYENLPEEDKLNNSYYLYDIGVHYKNGIAYSRKEPISLTMAEYKALEEVDPDQEYIVSADAEGILLEASDIGYSNAVSNLPCTTVQGAIDKVVEKVDGLIDDTTSSITNTYSSAKIDTKLEKKLFAWSNSPSALLGFEAKGTYTIEEFMKALYAVSQSGSVTLWFSNSTSIDVKHNDTTVTLNGGSLIWNGTDINKSWQAMSVTYIPASGNNIYKIRYATDGDVKPLNQGIEVYGGISDSSTSEKSTWSSSKIAQQDGIKQVYVGTSTSYPINFWILSDDTSGVFWFKHTFSREDTVKTVEGYADLTNDKVIITTNVGEVNPKISTDSISGKKGVLIGITMTTGDVKITEARPLTATPTLIVPR